jgi:hypothetical protein
MTYIRKIRIEGDVAYVPLTQGYEAVIDADDVHLVSGWNWSARVNRNRGRVRQVYAIRAEYEAGKQSIVRMHRVVAKTSEGKFADHIDGDGLNNRKANLRDATPSENAFNKKKSSGNASGFKGVHWHKKSGKWQAQIGINYARVSLGLFETAEAAAAAYASASAQIHGRFGKAV